MIPVAITNNISALRCRLLIQLIEHAGGIPLLIPTFITLKSHKKNRDLLLQEHLKRVEDILLISKAIIMPGNRLDVPPSFYGDSVIHPETAKRSCKNKQNVRFETECFMAQYALKNNMPFIGICGGMHVFNVVMGGSLVQHLPDKKEVREKKLMHLDKRIRFVPRDVRLSWEQLFIQHVETGMPENIYAPSHAISVEKDSYLGDLYTAHNKNLHEIYELSVHHQGCFDENLATGLKAIAYASDNVVEAAQLIGYPTMGLLTQFHWEANVGGIALAMIKKLLEYASQFRLSESKLVAHKVI